MMTLSSEVQITVMTYNIKYANESDGKNSWSERKEKVADLLKFYEPDIFGIQEGLKVQLQFIKENLSGYDYIGVGRDDGDQGGEFSPIFYDKSKFEVVDSSTFWLSETPNEVTKGWDAAYKRICTYAFFKERDSGKVFLVFNTHFDHKGEEAKKNSAELIVAKIKELNSANYPVILMGDFNLEPHSEAIEYVFTEMLDSKMSSEIVTFGPEGTFNAFNFQEPVTRRIDYIFTAKEGVKVKKYGVLSDSWDLKYPSDHFPVLVQIVLK